jgi:hypothetical protein
MGLNCAANQLNHRNPRCYKNGSARCSETCALRAGETFSPIQLTQVAASGLEPRAGDGYSKLSRGLKKPGSTRRKDKYAAPARNNTQNCDSCMRKTSSLSGKCFRAPAVPRAGAVASKPLYGGFRFCGLSRRSSGLAISNHCSRRAA